VRPHLLTSGSGTGTASHGGLTRLTSLFSDHTPYSGYCHSCSRFRYRVSPCCRCEAHSTTDSAPLPLSTAIDFRKRKSVVGESFQGPEVYYPSSRPSIYLCFQQINKTTSQHHNYLHPFQHNKLNHRNFLHHASDQCNLGHSPSDHLHSHHPPHQQSKEGKACACLPVSWL